MHFIEHSIIIKIDKNDEYVLINLLNGLSDILSDRDLNIMRDWKQSNKYQFNNQYEKDLYNALVERRYIMSNIEAEKKYKESKIENLKKDYEKSKNDIKDIGLVLTYDCNFSCSYCFESNVKKDENTLMTEEMIDRIEDLFSNIESILLYGGEPLLEKNMEIIKYIVKKYPNKKYRIITNGYNIDKYIDILKKIKIEWIQITLDGDRKTHDSFRYLKDRKIGTFNKLISNIDLAIENEISVKIRMNITNNNYQECLGLRDKLKKKYQNKGKLIFELQPIFQLDDKSKNILEPILYSVNDYTNNTINDYGISFQRTIIDGRPIELKFNNCSAETSARLVDSKGDIYSCLVSVGNENARIGKYYPKFEYFENSLINRNISTIESCRACKFALLCGGGCGNSRKDRADSKYRGECGSFMRKVEQYIKALNYNILEEVVL
ncbi:4Fe-4S cluster-binding domain-containing protein [Clostridium algidicarnis]|uniref:radical SAM/SPASM domain-containing protein n=1 Tax=Clostridium algidicarnis TaxID=37659 RepID=UPI001C0AD507|nr:radical SAM protein [Clostridium algidicarnis]MBU3209532.1 4Fe-4S cluster-binding domain-containing protein [Clostridium algidicarnis]